jgi:hypothetical protein
MNRFRTLIGMVLCAFSALAAAQIAADVDFATRAHAPGVVRAFDFDVAQPLYSTAHKNFALTPGASLNGNQTTPQLDTSVKASGAGSLRFDIPSLAGSDSAGAWFGNFSADYSVRFGENSEFFIQWRQRFTQALIDTAYKQAGGNYTAAKQVIVTAGDTPTRVRSSCEAIGVVVVGYNAHKFPVSYDSCTGSATHPPYAGFFERAPAPAVYLLQNAAGCAYGTLSGATAIGPQCFAYVADEWMTFELRVKTGPRLTTAQEWGQSEHQLWAAREGQAPVLLTDWRPGIPGYWNLTAGSLTDDQRFGKVYLTPYMTKRDTTQVTPPASVWYDELIVSRQPIAFPGGFALAVPRVVAEVPAVPAPVVDVSPYPLWRVNLPVGQWSPIPGTGTLTALLGDAPWAANIDASCGIALDEAGNAYWLAPGGHATTSYGGFRSVVLEDTHASDAPTVKLLLQPPPKSVAYDANGPIYPGGPRYADGTPATRHTYYTTQPVDARHAHDGVPRILLVTASAGIFDGFRTPDGKYYWQTGGQVEAFNLATQQWEPAGTYPDLPEVADTFYAVARDPRDGAIYAHASKGTWRLDVTKRTWTKLAMALPGLNRLPLEVDTKRNALVSVVLRNGALSLLRADLTSNAVSYTPVSGPLTGSATAQGRGLVYDPDGDRYLYLDYRVTNTLVSWAELYAIAPDTGVTTDLGALPKPWPTVAIDGRPKYSAALGGVVFAPRANVPALFLPTR